MLHGSGENVDAGRGVVAELSNLVMTVIVAYAIFSFLCKILSTVICLFPFYLAIVISVPLRFMSSVVSSQKLDGELWYDFNLP